MKYRRWGVMSRLLLKDDNVFFQHCGVRFARDVRGAGA